jgi:fumarylacetoacetase
MKDVANESMAMPVFIRDYTDFYSSKNHAYNVGVMMRGVDNALQPNWTHLPVGYHGRASSIVLDGTDLIRPKGQLAPPEGEKNPQWSACQRLDFELEMGTIIGKGNELGSPIKITDARDHIFGHCMLNDWSARDIQKWEYVPLGPFLAKNFASTISPWVITPEALAPFKAALPAQDPALLPYLTDNDLSAYDIKLSVGIKTAKMAEENADWHVVATSNMTHLYYSVAQTVTHHTVTGCNLATGDMLGSGTISAPEESGYGSLLELCWAGKKTVKFPNGEERKFLLDGDAVNLTGVCKGNGFTIGFGDCRGAVLPAKDDSHFF